MTESSQEPNIELLTYSEVVEVRGFVGNFEVQIRKKPRYVDESKCTGCGTCIEKCPSKVPSEFELGLTVRRAIYVPFAQAVPNVPVIDPTGAIDYEQQEEIITRKVGAIVVATGYSLFDPVLYGEYGAGRFKNVITSLQLERMLESNGPTGGKVLRPSDGQEAKTIVFLQCVGSRDEQKGIPYCSKICCMYTAKHCILVKDHHPDAQCYVFYIDIRAGGYLRGRVSKLYQVGDKVIVEGVDTLSGEKVEIEADLVVLAVAMIPNPDAKELAKVLNIPFDDYGFYTEAHPKLQPVESATRGLYIAGCCQFPRDIPDSVASGSAAAAKVCNIFSRDELVVEPRISSIDPEECTGCLACLEVCPYGAIVTEEYQGKVIAKVIETLCQG